MTRLFELHVEHILIKVFITAQSDSSLTRSAAGVPVPGSP